ncbi:hypothetical protein CDG77_25755 [Nostoc sp. 'Peltigera membranacea cyanobiont' 213]|uniref:hypothetical protein n=1 Tax=Nostoc sp. 'Peltigera membranacea cyanobiont' 213 TaxID=2014530 RepID=UPI000B9587A0|nr:hypothetical protein [Nostoc sp. 'Peltigera membranacea cyanobiont' 213]OYD88072.1 hypothetical protein CDG77_25755 [Nostoc sp. 'Peltigera membranacea cyanobiont' 213]
MLQVIDEDRSAFSDIQQGGIIIVPWITGMEAGIGYDSLTQKVKGKAGATQADLSWNTVTASSQTYNSQIRRIESNEELSNSLDISTSVSGSYGAFSATATGKFIKSLTVTSYSIYFLINSFVQNSEKVVSKFFLDEHECNLNADQFYQKYGDYYVSGVISGGSFLSLLEMQTNSREVKEQISTSLEANYDAKAFSIGGKFSMDIQNASKYSGVQLQVLLQESGVSGASDELKDGGTVENLIAAANGFPDRVKDGGMPLYAILTPYSVLQKPPQTRNFINVGVVEALRQDMNAIYLRAKTILESVTYALNHPSQFADEQDKFNQIKSQMEQILAKVAKANNDLSSGQDLELVQKEIPEMPNLTLIPQQLWAETKDNIAPPDNVIPSTIRYKLADAYAYLGKLNDEPLRPKLKAYLDQISQDLSSNFGNSYDLISKFSTNVRTLLANPLSKQTRNKLLDVIQNDLVSHQNTWSDAITNQKAMFAEIDTNDQEKNDQLQVIKNLNSQIWSTSETQYGGTAYWSRMAQIIDSLKTNISHWDSKTSGEEYISFKTGSWKQLQGKFQDAMKNFKVSLGN